MLIALPTLWRIIIRDNRQQPQLWLKQRLFYGTQSSASYAAASLLGQFGPNAWADIVPA